MMKRATSTDRMSGRIAVCAVFLFVHGALFGQSLPALGGNTKDTTALRIGRVERSLLPAVEIVGQPLRKMTLQAALARYQVPGVSVAAIHHGAIDWAKGYGVLRLKGPVVNSATLFQAASISKPVTATAVLRLVQEHKLSLDEDLNDRLRSWKVPNNQFTATHKVTLGEILSHSAGISVHGFPGYASSETVPTLIQVLNGEKPANTPPIRVISDPGSTWSYSGGGFVILQQELLDITGRSFAELMKKEVLDPLGMTHSTFEQPLPPRLAVFAATPYRFSGKAVDGGWHTYPEMAAAGLWTTPSDLARFAIALQQSLAGNRNAVLNADVATQMMTKQKQDWGLGVQLGGSDQSARFQHSGGNEGFRCFLVAYEHSGDGAVVMTNSDSGDRVAKALIRSIAHEYRWPDFKPKKRELAHVNTSLYAQYIGQYQVDPETILTIKRSREHLSGQITDELSSEIYPESSNRFFATDDDLEITFLRSSADTVNVAEIRFSGQRIRAPKIKPAPRNK